MARGNKSGIPSGAADFMNNQQAMREMLQSPDTKKLMEMLEQNAGGNLKDAAQAAMRGDTASLQKLVQAVMSSQEGSEVVGRISKNAPDLEE